MLLHIMFFYDWIFFDNQSVTIKCYYKMWKLLFLFAIIKSNIMIHENIIIVGTLVQHFWVGWNACWSLKYSYILKTNWMQVHDFQNLGNFGHWRLYFPVLDRYHWEKKTVYTRMFYFHCHNSLMCDVIFLLQLKNCYEIYGIFEKKNLRWKAAAWHFIVYILYTHNIIIVMNIHKSYRPHK